MLENLRLTIAPSQEISSGKGLGGFELRLTDVEGKLLMQVNLPSLFCSRVAPSFSETNLSMSPDGSIAVHQGGGDALIQVTSINLDDLVKQSISQDMIDDELHVQEMLIILRDRLVTAFEVVEATMLKLRK
jgi:hypothetical protein